MAEHLIDFLSREHQYVRSRRGRDFFLALSGHVGALRRKRRIRRVLEALEKESHAALRQFVNEQTKLEYECQNVRAELAERAPEIDNSTMERPDPTSRLMTRYSLDSFARFDELARADVGIGWPSLPDDAADPTIVTTLLIILRGRLRAAVFGEEAGPIDGPRLRDDLEDLGWRLEDIQERQRFSLREYHLNARTLPWLAYVRLASFGSDLNPEPAVIETDDDRQRALETILRQWGKPRTLVRKLIAGETLDEAEQRVLASTEDALKRELDLLHQELTRQVETKDVGLKRLTLGFVFAVASTVVAGLILWALGVSA